MPHQILTDLEIDGTITLPGGLSSPPPPPAGQVRMFGRSVGGRLLLAAMGPSGLDTVQQPHLARNSISSWLPAGNGTAVTLERAAALTAVGTATAATVSTTNRHQRMKRLDYLVTAAATNAIAGFRSTAAQWTVGAATPGDGGFHFIGSWGPATGVATPTSRAFFGMANTVGVPTDVEPSTISNIIGMGWDSADANIQLMHRGTGAVTKIDLGASFPVPTVDRENVYELSLFSPPGTTQECRWQVTDRVTGAVATGVISTNLPTAATLLAPRGWISVGGTSSVIGLALMGLYIETDY